MSCFTVFDLGSGFTTWISVNIHKDQDPYLANGFCMHFLRIQIHDPDSGYKSSSKQQAQWPKNCGFLCTVLYKYFYVYLYGTKYCTYCIHTYLFIKLNKCTYKYVY